MSQSTFLKSISYEHGNWLQGGFRGMWVKLGCTTKWPNNPPQPRSASAYRFHLMVWRDRQFFLPCASLYPPPFSTCCSKQKGECQQRGQMRNTREKLSLHCLPALGGTFQSTYVASPGCVTWSLYGNSGWQTENNQGHKTPASVLVQSCQGIIVWFQHLRPSSGSQAFWNTYWRVGREGS